MLSPYSGKASSILFILEAGSSDGGECSAGEHIGGELGGVGNGRGDGDRGAAFAKELKDAGSKCIKEGKLDVHIDGAEVEPEEVHHEAALTVLHLSGLPTADLLAQIDPKLPSETFQIRYLKRRVRG